MSVGLLGGYRIRRGEQKSNAESRPPFSWSFSRQLGTIFAPLKSKEVDPFNVRRKRGGCMVVGRFRSSRSLDQAHPGRLRDE